METDVEFAYVYDSADLCSSCGSTTYLNDLRQHILQHSAYNTEGNEQIFVE